MTVSYCNVLRRPLTGPSFFYLENILSLNMWPSMTGSFLSLLFHNIFWRRSKNVGKSSIWHRLDDVHFRTEMTTKMTWKEKVKYFRILFPGSRLAAKTKVVPADSPPFLWQTSLLNPGVPERLGTRLSVAGLRCVCVWWNFSNCLWRTWSNPFAPSSCWLTGTTGTRPSGGRFGQLAVQSLGRSMEFRLKSRLISKWKILFHFPQIHHPTYWFDFVVSEALNSRHRLQMAHFVFVPGRLRAQWSPKEREKRIKSSAINGLIINKS